MRIVRVLAIAILLSVGGATTAAASPMTFVYGPGETQRWYNEPRPQPERINRQEATVLAHYLNGIVWRQVAAYVRAVAAAQHDLIWHWELVAECESGGNWSINTGNGYYGGLQFLLSTWQSVGGTGYPHQHSAYEQSYRAEILRARAGLGQWPVCGSRYRY